MKPGNKHMNKKSIYWQQKRSKLICKRNKLELNRKKKMLVLKRKIMPVKLRKRLRRRLD